MFESYYELNDNPFRLSADESFRYAHKNYLKAWSYLSYALEQGEGFVMITGQPGCGKTTLIRDIVSQLDSTKTLAINLVTNQLQAEELLRKVALEYGLPAETYNKATLLTHIEEFVEKEFQQGRRAIIVIDEAQNLTLNGLEELRLLSNLQSGSHPLFQIFLVGQEELRSIILNPQMEQIRQRLIASCQIEPMSPSQLEGYIDHRLGIVGWHGDPELEPSIFPLIHYITEGIPRKINHVASRLLLYGALEGKHKFTDEDVWIVAEELFGEERLALKSGETFESFKSGYSIAHEQLESVETKRDSKADQDSVAVQNISEDIEEISDVMSNDESVISMQPEEDEIILSDSEASALAPHQSTQPDDHSGYVEEDTAQLLAESKSEAVENEIADLTARIVNENRVIADNLTFEAQADGLQARDEDDTVPKWTADTDSNRSFSVDPEDILSTPTMRAERRRHEIESSGGFIVTDDGIEKDELFSGGILRSIRNIALVMLIGVPLIVYMLFPSEQIGQFWADLSRNLQIMVASQSNQEQAQQSSDKSSDLQNLSDENRQVTQTDPIQSQAEQSVEQSETEIDTVVDEGELSDQVEESNQTIKDAGDDYIATQSRYQQVVVADTNIPVDKLLNERKFQIFFDEEDTEIPEEFNEMLDDLYIILSLNEQASLKISGFADLSGDPLHNMRLSLERAQKISNHFIDRGIDQTRIQIEGHSPITSNTNNKAQEALEKHLGSRRVEILLQGGSN
jgi:type II secretory pathway predicted ATPase ExeA/outer membrane protein OmpA-like peptidoglycan-associated protein